MSSAAFFTAEARCRECSFRVSSCGFTAGEAKGCAAYSHRKGQEHADLTGHGADLRSCRRTGTLAMVHDYEIVPLPRAARLESRAILRLCGRGAKR
jgi:hypothetical protein